ncbi:MAG: DUF378 domain-containing protein [Clostridia bacterium]|nr:DUF378 domain-containing protein [Clostridia bacterium]
MKTTSIIAYAGVIIGAIVWLLVGLFAFNPVTFIAGSGVIARIIYTFVGICALWLIFSWIVGRPAYDK